MGIRTYGELNKRLNRLVRDGMKKITKFATNEVKGTIRTYYDEFNPKRYKRTNQFLNSVVTEEVQLIGDTWFSSAAVDYGNMSYVYDYGEDILFQGDGYEVVVAANRGEHGVETVGYLSKKHFWDDAIVVTWDEAVMKDFVKLIETKTGCDCEPEKGWLML